MKPVICRVCQWTGDEDDLLPFTAHHRLETVFRLKPGQVVPAGECPNCGGEAHHVFAGETSVRNMLHDDSGTEWRAVLLHTGAGLPCLRIENDQGAGAEFVLGLDDGRPIVSIACADDLSDCDIGDPLATLFLEKDGITVCPFGEGDSLFIGGMPVRTQIIR